MELLRTLLFIPGNRANMIERARSLPTDVVVLDLEDSVPAAEKGIARKTVAGSLSGLALKGRKVFVRVNSLSSRLAEDDLKAVVGEGLDGITLPKVESAGDVEKVDGLVEALERGRGLEVGHIKLIPWVETALGLLRAYEIANASPRLVGIAFGAEDFTLDMGVERSTEGSELFYARSSVAIAARAADVTALDTPYVDFRDEEGLIRDCRLARQMGFGGKFLIHPDQIEPVNRLFRPSVEEVANARRIAEAFEAAEARGLASTSVDGKMIDIPVAKRARRVIALAEAIARIEGE